MRIALLSLLALLFLPASAVAEEVTFTWSPVRAGADITESKSMSMKFNIDMLVEGQSMGVMEAGTTEDGTLRSVTGPWTPRKKEANLTYGANTSSERQIGPDGAKNESAETALTSGKSYRVVAKKGKAPAVLYADGGEVPDAEKALVMEDWSDLAGEAPGDFEKALIGKTLRVGDALDSSNEAVGAMLSLGDDELSVTEASITLTEVREEAGKTCAVFSLAVTLVGEDGPMMMTMNVKGETIVEVDGLRPHSVNLAGPLTMEATMAKDGMEMRMAGGGEINFSLGYVYGD